MTGGAEPQIDDWQGRGSQDAASQATDSQGSGSPAGREVPLRLSLGDPLDGRASEDRPEAWGEHSENESDRLARYRAETPPHHGA